MVKDDQRPFGHAALKITAMVLAVTGVVIVTGFLMGCWLREPEVPADPPADHPAATAETEKNFRDWTRPDLALVISGEEHGYLQPCGCSRPQNGGLARRYNFLRTLRDRGWPVIAVDLGDVPQKNFISEQDLLKYKTAMEARQLMDYLAVGIGVHETALSLFDVLGNFALNNAKPRVLAANLHDKDNSFPGMVRSWEVGGGANGVPKIGVASILGPEVAKFVQDPQVRFDDAAKALADVARELQTQRPELLVLLYHGLPDDAKQFVARFPSFPFQLVVCKTKEAEPSGQVTRVGNTAIVGVGHKGLYVGVVAVRRTGDPTVPLKLDYKLACMVEDYETPDGKDASNPVHALLEGYAREVRQKNFLAQAPRTKHTVQLSFPKATYVGSEKCKRCHEPSYQVWKKLHKDEDGHERSHSIAYHSLEETKRPILRQYDPECVRCHVVGFDYDSGFRNEKETAHLKDVGCEVCHGPASDHLKNPNDDSLNALMNPFRRKPNETPQELEARELRIDSFCQKCHDIDNDVHFKFKEKWPKVIHREPRE